MTTAVAIREEQTIVEQTEEIHRWLVSIPAPEGAANMAIPRHPLSEMFKEMSDDEWGHFDFGIETQPIPEMLNVVIYEDKVLDGFHRYWSACMHHQVELLRFWRYVGPDPLSFVVLCNFNRRHLTSSERAGIFERALEMMEADSNGQTQKHNILGASVKARAAAIHVSTRQYQRAVATNAAGLGHWLVNGDITAEDGEQIARAGLAPLVVSGDIPIENAKERVRATRRSKNNARRRNLVGSPPSPDEALVIVGSNSPDPEVEDVHETPDRSSEHRPEAVTPAPAPPVETMAEPIVDETVSTPAVDETEHEPRAIDALRQKLASTMGPALPEEIVHLVDLVELDLAEANTLLKELQARYDELAARCCP